MSDYPMLISNKLHSFRNFQAQRYKLKFEKIKTIVMLNIETYDRLINSCECF